MYYELRNVAVLEINSKSRILNVSAVQAFSVSRFHVLFLLLFPLLSFYFVSDAFVLVSETSADISFPRLIHTYITYIFQCIILL